MYLRALLLVSALSAAAMAMFERAPKYGAGASAFRPVYLSPYGSSKYESYGKYDDQQKESHYQPAYQPAYEPKYERPQQTNDYYSSYQPSHQPYYGNSYYAEQPKYSDYPSSQNYYRK